MSIVPYGGGGDGTPLTPEQKQVLDNWHYDEVKRRMTTDASVRSGLNSFELAAMHTMHSGGENIFFENMASLTNWFPVWQGVLNFDNAGAGEHLGTNMTGRQYGNTYFLEPNGPTVTANSVPYTDTITLDRNESVLRLEVVAGESYTGRLIYSILDQNSTGIEKYRQTLDVACVAGDPLTFNFTHPSDTHAGSTIFVDIIKEDGSSFKVRTGVDIFKPWLKLLIAEFTDVPVWFTTLYQDESFVIRYSGDYEINLASQPTGITITVPANFKAAFIVSDCNQTFSPASPCRVDFSAFGQGIAVLQTPRDSYKFYHNGVEWRYKDLDYKNGGVV